MPLPELLYAQVVKSYRRRRIVGVKYRVVFGAMERVQQVLSVCGRKINTAYVERVVCPGAADNSYGLKTR